MTRHPFANLGSPEHAMQASDRPLAVRRAARACAPMVRAASGMGLGEMLLTLAGITLFLGVLTTVSNTVRTENADHQTRAILRSLHLAVMQYQSRTSDYPPGPASIAIHYLQRLPESEVHIRGLKLRADRDGYMTIDDGYGRPLKYIDPTMKRMRIGDFVSAGPDGIFGDMHTPAPRMHQAMMDNIYSSDVIAPNP